MDSTFNISRLVSFFEVSAFGEEVADEPVGVFVSASFPGMVGIGEVNLCIEFLFGLSPTGEFYAVVVGYGLWQGSGVPAEPF